MTAATAGPEVQFTDITRSTNIDFKHENSDDDGFTDIFVANDSVASFLYHNNGNGTFTEVGFPAGVAYNEDGKTFAGMGADFSDYDNDGRPDIVVTDLSNKRYHLFSQQRRRQLPGCDQPVRHGRRDFPFFRLEDAFVRLRQ